MSFALVLGGSISCQAPRGVPPEPPEAFTKASFEDDMVRFESIDAEEGYHPGCLLFIGSSSIRRWDRLQTDFGDLGTVVGRGFGGSQMADALLAVDRIVTPHHPSVVVVYEGDNDINAGKTPEVVLSEFQSFAQSVRRKSPRTAIVFLSIKASPDRWDLREPMRQANDLVRRYCERRRRLHYVDAFDSLLGEDGTPAREYFSDDLLHLSPQGYRVWTENLRPVLRRLVP